MFQLETTFFFETVGDKVEKRFEFSGHTAAKEFDAVNDVDLELVRYFSDVRSDLL